MNQKTKEEINLLRRIAAHWEPECATNIEVYYTWMPEYLAKSSNMLTTDRFDITREEKLAHQKAHGIRRHFELYRIESPIIIGEPCGVDPRVLECRGEQLIGCLVHIPSETCRLCVK